VPRAGEDFFNRLSSFLCDTLYVAAASDKQRGGRARPTHKNPSKLKRVWRDVLISQKDAMRPPTKSTVFLFGGLVKNLELLCQDLLYCDSIIILMAISQKFLKFCRIYYTFYLAAFIFRRSV